MTDPRREPFSKKLGLAYLTAGAPMILFTFFLPGGWAQWLFAALAMLFPVALIVVGASRAGGLGPLILPLCLLALLLEGGLLAMSLLSRPGFEGRLVAGLPPATAVMLGVLWLGPLGLVAWAYASTFDRFGLREEDLERLREHRRDGSV